MSKMSKLDRFLVSESVISGSPNIKAVTLERFLSDHRPILLKENGYDYGPTPFRFFHHWLEMDGFNTFVENTWKNSPMVGNNALLSLMNKLRNLKNQIRIWNKSNSGTRKNDQLRLKKQLEEIDLDIDRGLGNEELVNSRLAILHQIQKIDNLESKERAQKAKIKWAVEGDENSGFFHGIINKRRNIQNIRGVMVDGNWIENPNDVKKEFFDHFANRFGKPDKPTASISLDFPNQISHEQSDHMEREVSNDEIKKSVWECGTDKAPGPDGFTFGFFRHFWHLVDRDVCEAVRYFFKFSDLPKGCNSSFIALIPKIPDANLVKDFRPISLIGSIYKIIAKILTNRLVDVLGGIINEVQSAFIKDRQILDGPFILNEVMSWCKKKKKQTLLFKVDFEKAYDSVRWDFLDDVLGKFGFGDKWRKWIQCCLHSSKGSIIINGSPTDEFQFGRGLKQGDPLSPFLFLLIMESLHISFQRVVDAGMFHGIDVGGLVNLSHMFYADDAVFIGEWSESNITSLIHVLDCFHKVSGLKINMCKSKIMGIEVDNGKVSRAATKFGCLVLKAPFLYLGSYVGGDMNKIQSWKDIIDRIRRRLSRWKMKMLSIGGRLMLIKSVLGSMPIFHMSMFKVPAGVIQILESLRSKFFNGHESSGKKASWVQWKKALAPKDNGGLGIFSLYALNRGLIFKWVWRFLAHEPTLWSRVIKAIHGANGKIDEISGKGANSCWINIIKEVRRLEEKGINLLLFMKKKLGNGLSTLFWDDVWCDGGKLKNRFPRAYALENSKQITVGQKLAHPSLYHSFRRHPRGGLELTQVEELAKVINPVVLTQSPDSWSWTLNNSGGYTVASSRNMIDSRLLPKGDLKTRWIRYVPNKVNTFAWKVMTNSLPTRFNISRRGIDIESLSCVNCDVGIETNDHLFFACNTAKKISKLINRWWDVPFMDINSYGEWRSWIDNVKLPKKNKSMFQVFDDFSSSFPALVLDDSCLVDCDMSNHAMGKVKDFSSIPNLYTILKDEGFSDVKLSYLGGLWVLFEYMMNHTGVNSWFHVIQEACNDFVSDERIVWVDIEGVPLNAWSRGTFTRIGRKWEETLDLEDNADTSFGRKRLCVKTKHTVSILESFKMIIKGKVFMVRAKELFTWNPTFLVHKEREYSSEDKSVHTSINNEFNPHPNEEEPGDDYASDEDGVPETVFGSSSFSHNHDNGDKDATHSKDPFGIYDLLKNKKGGDNHEPSPSLSHPPGFTPEASEK
ncbi:RNA-directed DNA polymerase, eukaryota [Tanacetum coccineum]